jgi:hypothetical protein
MDDFHFNYNTKIGGKERIGYFPKKKPIECPHNSPPYPLTFFLLFEILSSLLDNKKKY